MDIVPGGGAIKLTLGSCMLPRYTKTSDATLSLCAAAYNISSPDSARTAHRHVQVSDRTRRYLCIELHKLVNHTNT